MATPLIAGLPPGMYLPAGYRVRLNALDPVSGATVSGVVVTDVSLYVHDLSRPSDGDAPPPLLVPSTE